MILVWILWLKWWSLIWRSFIWFAVGSCCSSISHQHQNLRQQQNAQKSPTITNQSTSGQSDLHFSSFLYCSEIAYHPYRIPPQKWQWASLGTYIPRPCWRTLSCWNPLCISMMVEWLLIHWTTGRSCWHGSTISSSWTWPRSSNAALGMRPTRYPFLHSTTLHLKGVGILCTNYTIELRFVKSTIAYSVGVKAANRGKADPNTMQWMCPCPESSSTSTQNMHTYKTSKYYKVGSPATINSI